MKKQSINYILLVFYIIFSLSCTKDLNLAPTSIISANSFWKTPDDAKGGLYGMYDVFRSLSNTQGQKGPSSILYFLGEARSEIMGYGIGNPFQRVKYYENSLDAVNADLDWQALYIVIGYANLVIKNVPGIQFSNTSDKNSFLAQAYAMRAFIYFTVTEPTGEFTAKATFKPREPVSKIFDLIKSDINQALKLFPDSKFPVGRSTWSKPATYVLKGDVYLWTGKIMNGGATDFTTALNALDSAQNSDVSLLGAYSDIFSYTNKGNKEVIFAANFQDLEANNNYFTDMYGAGDNTKDIDQATATKLGTNGGSNYWACTALVRNQFTDDDQRKAASFLEIYTHKNGIDEYYTSVVMKGRGVVINGIREFLCDVIIYRYAELLLLKAEAENALGMDPSVEMNAVRKRAYGVNFPAHQFVNGSKEVNDEAILQERLFELAFEGKRWWDLVRFGKAFEKIPSLQGRQQNSYLLLWPVTQQTITLNSEIRQTPGY
jgi:starch-binding outer membrane protein, SusD/RagB family